MPVPALAEMLAALSMNTDPFMFGFEVPLLPKYPGLHPQQQALDDGATESGATVHFVNNDLDAGPIVLQRSVPVLPGDTADELASRILEIEHALYPDAIASVLAAQ